MGVIFKCCEPLPFKGEKIERSQNNSMIYSLPLVDPAEKSELYFKNVNYRSKSYNKLISFRDKEDKEILFDKKGKIKNFAKQEKHESQLSIVIS